MTATRPARWLTVADLRPGDTILTDNKGTTAQVAEVVGSGRPGKFRVMVAGRTTPYYPHATASTPVLVRR